MPGLAYIYNFIANFSNRVIPAKHRLHTGAYKTSAPVESRVKDSDTFSAADAYNVCDGGQRTLNYGASLTLTSPNYPYSYSDNTRCEVSWHLHVRVRGTYRG